MFFILYVNMLLLYAEILSINIIIISYYNFCLIAIELELKKIKRCTCAPISSLLAMMLKTIFCDYLSVFKGESVCI